uniref:Uncharacterized protein n=2 Tax=Triticum urartu TaxID=4572 RepID=A0A8R7ULT5_TRIUA
MGAGMKRAREEEPIVSLALSLSTDSSASTTTSDDSGTGAPAAKKRTRRGRVVAMSGEGEFVCKTCGRAFETFQALGGRTGPATTGVGTGWSSASAPPGPSGSGKGARTGTGSSTTGTSAGWASRRARLSAATCVGTARRWRSTGGSRCRIRRRGTRPPPTSYLSCSSCSSSLLVGSQCLLVQD